MSNYDAPYLSEEEHSVLDHTGVPGVGGESESFAIGDELTIVENSDDGFSNAGPDNKPLFAMRTNGDTEDRLQFWAGGYMLFGNGTDYPFAEIALTDDNLVVTNSQTNKGLILGDNRLGFFGTSPVLKPQSVPVTIEAVHAALVSLGLIDAP